MVATRPGSPGPNSKAVVEGLQKLTRPDEVFQLFQKATSAVYFKAETGYSFREWVNKVRIEQAKRLVAGTDLKYYEIATRVGYKSYKYFSAHFAKYCGCSAKEYRLANTEAKRRVEP